MMIVVKSFDDQEYLIENQGHVSLKAIEQELMQQISFTDRSKMQLCFFFDGELVNVENEEILSQTCMQSCLYLTVSVKQGLVGGKGGMIYFILFVASV
jgi:hypothetical protein